MLGPVDTAACCPPLAVQPLSAEQAEQVAPLLKALADPVRLRLMSLVASHPGGDSNCVINLSGNKPAVLAESFRVLRPGGRFGVFDILAENHLTETERVDRGSHVGCIARTLSFDEYQNGLARTGFTRISITPDPPGRGWHVLRHRPRYQALGHTAPA